MCIRDSSWTGSGDAADYYWLATYGTQVEPKFTIQGLQLTWKQVVDGSTTSQITVAGYRTEGNQFLRYRITPPGGSTVLRNTPGGTDLSLWSDDDYDEPADNDPGFLVNEIDYQSTGELDNAAPLCAYLLMSHDDRIFYVSGSEPTRVYFSKRPTDDTAPGFNEALYIQLPTVGGAITGLSVLDNKLVVFQKDLVYMVSGEGPDNTGRNGQYSIPRLVASDVGCNEQRSIVTYPGGVLFKSDKGIYQLNRGESVSYIGAVVDAYNDQSVTGSELLADESRVIFLTEDSVSVGSHDPNTLVFDYQANAWTVFSNHAGIASIVVDETYYYMRADGEVYQADNSYTDGASTAINYTLETAWLRPSGIQRLWKLYSMQLIGTFQGDSDIKVTVYVNYQPTSLYNFTFNTSNAAGSAGKPVQFKHIFKEQNVMSIKLKIEGVTVVSSNAAVELQSISIMAGAYSGNYRLDQGRQI